MTTIQSPGGPGPRDTGEKNLSCMQRFLEAGQGKGGDVALSSLRQRYHVLMFTVNVSQWRGAHSFWPRSANNTPGAPAGVLELYI